MSLLAKAIVILLGRPPMGREVVVKGEGAYWDAVGNEIMGFASAFSLLLGKAVFARCLRGIEIDINPTKVGVGTELSRRWYGYDTDMV